MNFLRIWVESVKFKIFEVENLIKCLNGKTKMEHVTFAKNLS